MLTNSYPVMLTDSFIVTTSPVLTAYSARAEVPATPVIYENSGGRADSGDSGGSMGSEGSMASMGRSLRRSFSVGKQSDVARQRARQHRSASQTREGRPQHHEPRGGRGSGRSSEAAPSPVSPVLRRPLPAVPVPAVHQGHQRSVMSDIYR